jgi:FkbM family methyltransferase
MLINFKYIVEKYGKPKGIIHIGAHCMEERSDYLSEGLDNTIWLEANPKTYEYVKSIVTLNESEKLYNFAISDIDNTIYDLNVTNNGQSSSILELDLHKKHHPGIYVTEVLKVPSKRMDSLIAEENIDIRNYDFINLDIQGAELLALKGFGNFLNKISKVYVEVNTNYLYKNCSLIQEIDDYLSKFKFKRVETNMTQFEWGDAFYVKDVDINQ